MDKTKKILLTNIISAAFGIVWFSTAFGIPTSMLFEVMTGSGIMLGLFTTFVQISAVFQVFSALFSEYFHNRKAYWFFFVLSSRILWLSPTIVILLFWNRPNFAALVLIICLALATSFGNFSTPIWFDWMAELIPHEISEKYWGIRQSVTSLVFFIATALTGYILDFFPAPNKLGGSYTGFLLVFTIAGLAGILEILFYLKVPYDLKTCHPLNSNIFEKLLLPFKNDNFRNMSLAYASWFLSIGIIGPFGFIYLKRVFGATYMDLSIIASAASLSAIFFSFLNGLVIKRIGARAYFCIAMGIIPLFWVAWFFAGETIYNFEYFSFSLHILEVIFLIGLASFLGGIFASGVAICQLHMINTVAEKAWRRIGIAEHWAIIGIVSAIGPFIGGAITDYFTKYPISLALPSGQNFSYIHILIILASLIAWFLAIPFMMKVKLSKNDIPIDTAITVVYLYPLRGFGLAANFLRNILRG